MRNSASEFVKVGDILDRKYRVERIMGRGGMGVVVEATHLKLKVRRAIKLMLPEMLDDEDSVQRFLQEAEAAAKLKSKYAVRVQDFGTLGTTGANYIVMEYLEGTDLDKVLKQRGCLPVEEAVRYVMQACIAMKEAHSSGIVHRDLKPANMFLTKDEEGLTCIKVLDFGIAKVTDSSASAMTITGTVLGTPRFMSPEQMKATRYADARSDIWSLGVILYHFVTGQYPFEAPSISELAVAILTSEPKPPSVHGLDLPRALEAAVMRCLNKDPDKRFQTVAEFSQALEPFSPNAPRASSPSLLQQVPAWEPEPLTQPFQQSSVEAETLLQVRNIASAPLQDKMPLPQETRTLAQAKTPPAQVASTFAPQETSKLAPTTSNDAQRATSSAVAMDSSLPEGWPTPKRSWPKLVVGGAVVAMLTTAIVVLVLQSKPDDASATLPAQPPPTTTLVATVSGTPTAVPEVQPTEVAELQVAEPVHTNDGKSSNTTKPVAASERKSLQPSSPSKDVAKIEQPSTPPTTTQPSIPPNPIAVATTSKLVQPPATTKPPSLGSSRK